MSATEARSRGRSIGGSGRIAALALSTAISLGARTIYAQTPGDVAPSDQAAAQVLFDEGERLLGNHRLDEACAKLKESQRLDPAPGTLLNLAHCYEESGKLATAWAAYREGATLAERTGRGEWAALGARRLAALEPTVPRLLLRVAVPGAEVTVNGMPVAPSEWGLALPVDPGPFHIEAHAQGKRSWRRDLVVRAGDRAVLDVELEDEPTLRMAWTTSAIAHDPRADAAARPMLQRYLAVGVGGLGVVGIGTGAAFGLAAIQKKNAASSLCPAKKGCSATASHDADDARTAAGISTVAFVSAGALLATGALLYITAPMAAAASPRRKESGLRDWRLSIHPAGVVWAATF